jgi:hypothetical protein
MWYLMLNFTSQKCRPMSLRGHAPKFSGVPMCFCHQRQHCSLLARRPPAHPPHLPLRRSPFLQPAPRLSRAALLGRLCFHRPRQQLPQANLVYQTARHHHRATQLPLLLRYRLGYCCSRCCPYCYASSGGGGGQRIMVAAQHPAHRRWWISAFPQRSLPFHSQGALAMRLIPCS